jgi:hypothetical protein
MEYLLAFLGGTLVVSAIENVDMVLGAIGSVVCVVAGFVAGKRDK